MFNLKKKNLISFVIYVFCLLLIFFLSTSLKTFLSSSLKQPFSLSALLGREFNAIIFYRRNFYQNDKFRKDIDFLKNKLNAQQEAILENARLKSLLSFKQSSGLRLIAARVIGRAADNWSSSIIVDKGKRQGIKSAMTVINYLGIVGRVIEAYESSSKILLINDPNLSVSAIVQRSRQEGLVSGTLGVYLIMKYLPEYSDIAPGDLVITSGLSEFYPKGLLIGSVMNIGKEFSGLSRYATIKPAVNLSELEEVLIVVP